MRILPENTMALTIDMQEKLVPAMSEKERCVDKTLLLMKGLNELGIDQIISQQYTKGLGMSIPEIYEALESENYFDKTTFSCYKNDAIRKYIDDSGKKNIIISGIEAHICVLQTCIDLAEAGYQPILVTDAISSRDLRDKESAIIRAQQEGVLITCTESILYELLIDSKAPAFKAISNLVK